MRGLLLLVLAGGVLGLLGAEMAARLAARGTCRDHIPGITARHPLYGWGHPPNMRGWIQRCLHGVPEWRTLARTNARGLRDDRDVPYARSGAFRILVLGDSFTEGLQVDLDATFARRLERALRAAGAPVEVLNAGVSAWGTDNALLWFRHEGRRYRPDLVLLAFNTGNDVFENHRPLVTAARSYPDKPYFRLVDGRLVLERFPLPPDRPVHAVAVRLYRALEPVSALVRRLGDVSFAWRFLQAPLTPAPGAPEAVPGEVYLRDYPEPWREAWRITRGLLLRLRAEVEASGARFAVVVLNGREEVSEPRMRWIVARWPWLAGRVDADRPNRLVTAFLARRGIPAIPLLDAFRARFAADATPGYFRWDIHWTADGHALAAATIERGLRRHGLVPLPAAGGRAPSPSASAAATRSHAGSRRWPTQSLKASPGRRACRSSHSSGAAPATARRASMRAGSASASRTPSRSRRSTSTGAT
jgi:hypothetical protein